MNTNRLVLPANSDSLKDLIVSLLLEELQLNAKKIHSKISQQKNVSYQAVHKALTELNNKKVIEKEKHKYKLSLKWIETEIQRLHNAKKLYLGKEKLIFQKNPEGEYKYTNWTELCVEFAKFFGKTGSQKQDNKQIALLEYGWWPFKFRFKDFFLIRKMVKNDPCGKIIIQKDTSFGRWICKQYLRLNGKAIILGKTRFDEDIFIQNDLIYQIKFSKDTKRLFKKYFQKFNGMEDTFKEFGLRKEPKIDATLTITRNQSLANLLKEQFETIYKNATKKEKKK
jgi:hypothetical protein